MMKNFYKKLFLTFCIISITLIHLAYQLYWFKFLKWIRLILNCIKLQLKPVVHLEVETIILVLIRKINKVQLLLMI